MPLKLAASGLIKWLGGGTVAALLALGAGWLWHEWQTGRLEAALAEARGEATELRASRDEWRTAARARAARLDLLAAELEAAREAVDRLQHQLVERDQDYRALRQRIRTAPAEDDGPVAPVLRRTLEELP